MTGVGLVSAAGSAWLLLAATDGRAVDQALLLALTIFLTALLEAQRWMPSPDAAGWYPTRLFRVHETGLLLITAVTTLWGLIDPSSRSFG